MLPLCRNHSKGTAFLVHFVILKKCQSRAVCKAQNMYTELKINSEHLPLVIDTAFVVHSHSSYLLNAPCYTKVLCAAVHGATRMTRYISRCCSNAHAHIRACAFCILVTHIRARYHTISISRVRSRCYNGKIRIYSADLCLVSGMAFRYVQWSGISKNL